MLRWATSTTIPLPNCPEISDADCSDTHKIDTVECIHEDFESTTFIRLTSDGPNLYMIRSKMAGAPRDFISDYTVFVMDTTKQNLEWQKVLVFRYHDYLESCQMLKETLYFICQNQKEVMIIDLSQKNLPAKIEWTEGVTLSATILKYNDTLHVVVDQGNSGRDTYNCIFSENGDKVFHKQSISRNTFLDSYDFADKVWIRKNVESTDQDLTIKAALELDNKIYVIVRTDWDQHDIRVLDLNPSLSDICWTNVAVELALRNDKELIQEMRNQLPYIEQIKLDSVVNWRIAEKDKAEEIEMRQLLKERFSRVIQEIYGMSYDEEICEEQEKQLIDLFKREDLPNEENTPMEE